MVRIFHGGRVANNIYPYCKQFPPLSRNIASLNSSRMENNWKQVLANKKTVEIPGAECLTHPEVIGGLIGMVFFANNKTLPSRAMLEHLDMGKVVASLVDGWLAGFECLFVSIDGKDSTHPDELLLQRKGGDVLLSFHHNHARNGTYTLRLAYRLECLQEVSEWIEGPLKELRKGEPDNQKGKFMLLTKDPFGGLDARRAEIDTKQVLLEKMYGPEVGRFAEKIIPELNEGGAGLFIMHGLPGTGKTSFLSYLIRHVSQKFIFIPHNLVDALALPDFMELLMEHRNAIMVIEDAEKALQKRNRSEHSPVSSLLNLTDGLLGDILNIKVICTLNSDLTNIDPALLRKGRLIGKCYFGKLPVDRANDLANHLGKDLKFTEDVILAEVFKPTEVEFGQIESQSMGFR